MAVFLLVAPAANGQYKGTGAVTQGSGQVLTSSMLDCPGGRKSATGTITDKSGGTWVLPAMVEFGNVAFPFAPDLYNSCNGNTYSNTAAALNALSAKDVVIVDADGEVITAFVFADNYFEMSVNGVPVGKDKVPFTQFNSSVIRFRVKRPFSIAVLCVDWEEALGLGTELNGGLAYHPGDGGLVAVFRDSMGNTIAKTGKDWKAQNYYTAPVKDLNCPEEKGNLRLSGLCSTTSAADGSAWYGLHWSRPVNWTAATFSDTAWPQAFEYTNGQIGVDNKPAYTNFTDVFDRTGDDAVFIWSNNVILDNEVLFRYVVGPALSAGNAEFSGPEIINPVVGRLILNFPSSGNYALSVLDETGRIVTTFRCRGAGCNEDVSGLRPGTYILAVSRDDAQVHMQKIILLEP